MYSPFDFNEADRHRREHVEDRLRDGSPIVGISYDAGLLLLTVRGSQRKIFEVYDRLIYSAIGHQADLEAIRVGAINFAHQEGFDRSPDDVTAQRLIGFQLSPPLKRLFGDQWNAPAVIRALFGELGGTSAEDTFFVLNYDGEFSQSHRFAAVAGTAEAEDRMVARLQEIGENAGMNEALDRALKAWGAGALESRRRSSSPDEEENPLSESAGEGDLTGFLTEELKTGKLEVGILDRKTSREGKFRLLDEAELAGLLKEYR